MFRVHYWLVGRGGNVVMESEPQFGKCFTLYTVSWASFKLKVYKQFTTDIVKLGKREAEFIENLCLLSEGPNIK